MSSDLFRRRILIIEDNALIGLTLADVLAEEGFLVIGPAASWAEALSLMEQDCPDAVIIDLTLRDGFCTGLARELHARGVPFVVYSGHRRDCKRFPELAQVPWVEKPGSVDGIIAALSGITPAVGSDVGPRGSARLKLAELGAAGRSPHGSRDLREEDRRT